MDFSAASVALFRANQVLLIQRARAPWLGRWTLPGGRREGKETALQCAMREVEEELGLLVASAVPVTSIVIAETHKQFFLAVFASNDWAGQIRAQAEEVADIAWVDPLAVGHLPTTPELPDILRQAVRLVSP